MNKKPEIAIKIDNASNDKIIEAIYAKSFGPGRFTKAASILREGNICLYDLSRIAINLENGIEKLIGACRMWQIKSEGGESAIFLGPIAVDKEFQSFGLGGTLVREVLQACDETGHDLVLLVGDLSFFGQFGFEIVPDGQIKLPLPALKNRILWRKKNGAGDNFTGRVFAPRDTKGK